jgi:Tfp pilus assembly protein PilX
MKKIFARANNEEGSIMVIALLIMAVLTILGISAIDTSNIELLIASNERVYKDNFYKAEAAVIAAGQTLENMTPGQLGDISIHDWINLPAGAPTLDNLQLTANAWNTGNLDSSTTDDIDLAGAQFTVVEETGFIDLSAPSNLHEYKIYGVYDSSLTPDGKDRGRVIIEIGYKRRF